MARAAATISVLFFACSVLTAREPVRARNGMVVAQEPLAAEVGLRVLQSGGNAVDAAVAVAFALAVTHPAAGNIGGGGFLLIRKADGHVNFLDFRERAPAASTRDMYLDASGNPTKDSVLGWKAAGVPGTVRGLEYAHRKYGSKRWADLVRPAVAMARDGVTLSHAEVKSIREDGDQLEHFPESKRIFLNGGRQFEPGDRLVQKELAATLSRIARFGARDFYEGQTARILAEECARNGGLITLKDLADYKVAERAPVQGRYRGLEIITAPPPSSGGLGLLQMLAVLEGSGYQKAGAGAAETIHYVAEVMRRFYADRSEHFGDPDFFRVPSRGLLEPGYVSRIRGSISRERATPSERVKPGAIGPAESGHTTHISIVDKHGTAVALTYTINESYGSGVTVPRLGFLLNNEMDDFSAKPGAPNAFGLVQGEANRIEPRKRPVSSMTPTVILREGKLYLVLGAPGGSRITTGVLQVILNIVDHGMNVQDAVDAPRFHHQWKPDQLRLERGFSPDTIALLKAKGHEIEPIETVARVEAILIDGGWLQGGADGRSDSRAMGY